MSEQQKIGEFQMITGVDEAAARTWLNQSNWQVDLAMDRYFNAGSAPPQTFSQPTIVPQGPTPEEILFAEKQKKKQAEDAQERLLSRCILKYRKPKPLPISQSLQPVATPTYPAPKPEDELVPLKGVDASVVVNHLVADVSVSQRFYNVHDEPMEAFFSFRQDRSSLYHFEADINGKNIVGVCKEKEEALDKYDNAISGGHGAFLVEQGETSDSFKMSIGNLPPKKECIVSTKYVTELETEGEAIRLNLPITRMNFSVAEQDEKSTSDLAQKVPSGFNLKIDFKMGCDISGIQCQTHHIASDIQGNQATLFFKDDVAEKDRNEMILLIGLTKPHTPTAVIEQDISSSSSSSSTSSKPKKEAPKEDAIMLSFFPELDVDEDPVTELIMLVDQSGSMAGTRINQAKNALQLFLRSLSEGTKFNIIGFGSSFHKLFPSSVDYNQDNLAKAINFASGLEANLGGTDILSPLQQIFREEASLGNRQVMLLTDGDVSNTGKVIDMCREHASETRVFTFGIGGECSLSLVKGCAQAARGHYEFVVSGERIETKVLRSLKRIMQPILSDVTVDWGKLDVRQTPKKLPPVFSGEKLLVYGFLKSTPTEETQVTLKGKIGEKEYQFPIQVSLAAITSGTTVHRLATRSLIRDVEFSKDENTSRDDVVPLATKYGLVSKFTSIVAIDKRSDQVEGSGAMVTVDVEQNRIEKEASRKMGNFSAFHSQQSYSPDTTDSDSSDEENDDTQLFELNEQTNLAVAKPAVATKFKKKSSPFSFTSLFGGTKAKTQSARERQSEEAPVALSKSELWSMKDEKPTLPTTGKRVSGPSAQARPLDRVVFYQQANGSWVDLEALAQEASLSKDSILKAFGSVTDTAIIATALAIVLLEKKFQNETEEWALLVEKAKKWLRREATKQSLQVDNLTTAAASLFSFI